MRDPAVFELLDVARRIFNNNELVISRPTLEQLEEENTQELNIKSTSIK